MGPGDKFCLQWNDFERNISEAFKELREEKDFFDVTLACEEEEIQAHKLILAACSPFFRLVLTENLHCVQCEGFWGTKFFHSIILHVFFAFQNPLPSIQT